MFFTRLCRFLLRSKARHFFDFVYNLLPCRTSFVCLGDLDIMFYSYFDELSKAVRCRVKLIPGLCRSNPGEGSVNHFNAVVDLNYDDDLHKLPFLFMTAGGNFSFNDTHKQNFRSYVEQGGFILMDDCVADGPGDYFYHRSCRLLEHLFGKAAVKEISIGHEIFHNIYGLNRVGIPYVQGTK